MATSGPGLGFAVQGAGTLLSIAAQIQQARAAAKALRFNAAVAERNAEQEALGIERDIVLTQIAGEREAAALVFDLETFDRTARLATGATRAAIGAAGTEFSGSNLIVAIAQAEELATQRSIIQFVSDERQRDLDDRAALLEFQAGEVRQAGALQQGLLRKQASDIGRALPLTAATTALQGASAINRQVQTRKLLGQTRRGIVSGGTDANPRLKHARGERSGQVPQ